MEIAEGKADLASVARNWTKVVEVVREIPEVEGLEE